VTESAASAQAASPGDPAASGGLARRRLLYAAPLIGFGALAVLFASGLGRDPGRIPSALIGQAVPKFSLPPVMGRTLGLSSDDLLGEVSLVNVFASWCVACREEHPLLMRLSTDKQIKIHGLNYKDEPENAARWLNANGDPYSRTGADRDGRVAIDWGVFGVPETFVVGADGRIAYKQIGPLSEEALERTIMSLVARLRGKAGA
jgi:cytochrome c biogenesis protein CcmG/thiol:disulfide interchange protein DsbE